MAQDYYEILGVSKTATAEEIKKAYRKLAHTHHPDKSNGGSEDKFKQVNEAYRVLSDPEKRKRYDQFGPGFDQAGRGFGGFSGNDFSNFAQGFGFDFSNFASGGSSFGGEDPFDIFSDLFGARTPRRSKRRRGVDLEMELELKFEEAVFGTEKEIRLEKNDTCQRCQGSGAEPGSKISTCPKCHGTGQIRTTKQTIFGSVASVAVCDECDGSAKVAENACRDCHGSGILKHSKTLKVRIPAGIEDGSRIRVTGEGEAGYKGSGFGDLYLRIAVAPHEFFRREGMTIYSEMPLSFFQAALGAVVETPTLDGKVKLKIPAGTQTGKVFRLKGKGAPAINRNTRGDQLVTVRVVTPTKLTKKEKELFKQLAEENGEATEADKNFWERFKS